MANKRKPLTRRQFRKVSQRKIRQLIKAVESLMDGWQFLPCGIQPIIELNTLARRVKVAVDGEWWAK